MTTNHKITTHTLVHDDAFRNAFQSISRAAIPFMEAGAYFTDLLHDAAQASALEPEQRVYVLVRAHGTHTYAYPDDAVAHIDRNQGRAVLRVVRGKYDSFNVTVVYDQSGYRTE